MIIRRKAYPRAGLIGNPSDGYFGKTIALSFTNFAAEVVLYETPELEILPNTRDHSRFGSIQALVEDVRRFGYYGGIRLLKAAIRRFHDYCTTQGIELHDRNFTIRYGSDIPHMVGLAGSSAIITACMRALMVFYGVSIPRPELANLILSVENEELGICAGLQDRVAQVYQGLVYMDFARDLMERQGHGHYQELDAETLPRLYIAYRADLAEGSEVQHAGFRDKYLQGDPAFHEAVAYWADLTDTVRGRLESGKGNTISDLLDANFDRRAEVCSVSLGNRRMIEAARAAGASAKFTGSGGAIIGTYENEAIFQELRSTLEPLQIHVFKPVIAPPVSDGGAEGCGLEI